MAHAFGTKPCRAGRALRVAGRGRVRRSVAAQAAAPALEVEEDVDLPVQPDDLAQDGEAKGEEDLYAEFAQLLEGNVLGFTPGARVIGTVISTDRKGALVDVGGKGAAFCPLDQVSAAHLSDAGEVLRVGMVREFEVMHSKTEDIMLTMASREKKVLWRRLEQMAAEDVTITGAIVAVNLGGAVIDIKSIRGFIPKSHLSSAPLTDMEELVGTEMKVKFLEVDEEGGRVMMSARRVESANTFTNFKIGDVVEGVVARVVTYGCFVEVPNGGTGLLHISQISHDRVTSIEDLLSVGDRLKVMIMAHDRERGRLAFSTKKLEPSPGDMLKDPAKVFARAEEMAQLFKIRVAAAEQAAREEEARLVAGTDPGADMMPADMSADMSVDSSVDDFVM